MVATGGVGMKGSRADAQKRIRSRGADGVWLRCRSPAHAVLHEAVPRWSGLNLADIQLEFEVSRGTIHHWIETGESDPGSGSG